MFDKPAVEKIIFRQETTITAINELIGVEELAHQTTQRKIDDLTEWLQKPGERDLFAEIDELKEAMIAMHDDIKRLIRIRTGG